MITNAFLDIVTTLCGWIVSILPAWSVSLPSSVTSFVSTLMGFDAILPVTETLTCMSLLAGLVGVMAVVKWSIKIVDYIADVIP